MGDLLLFYSVLLLSSSFVFSRPASTPDQLPVCIIGAGFAGLSAASELQKAGVNYIVLEGAERVGGRVYPVQYEDGFLQYGATYINGDNNPMYDIAKANDLLDMNATEAEDEYWPVYTENELIQGCDVREFTAFSESFATKYKEYAINGHEKESFAEAFKRDYKDFLKKKNRESRRSHFDVLARMYATDMETEYAALMNKYALDNYEKWDDQSKEGTEYTLNKMGFKKILDVIKEGVDMSKVKFNSEVKNIDYSNGDRVKVRTTKGNFDCSSAIVTVSLGYLKKHSPSLFTPPLPESKQAAIRALGFGNMQKLFLVYEKPWLEKTKFAAYHTMGPSTSVVFGRGLSFDATHWSKRAVQFWFSGPAVEAIGEMSDCELIDEVTDHLKKTLKNFTVPRAKEVIRHMWYKDPLVLGSYSYLTPEAVALKDPNEKLAEQIMGKNGRPLVLFAGEATHTQIFQTTIGAFLSGKREARRIMGKESSKESQRPQPGKIMKPAKGNSNHVNFTEKV